MAKTTDPNKKKYTFDSLIGILKVFVSIFLIFILFAWSVCHLENQCVSPNDKKKVFLFKS